MRIHKVLSAIFRSSLLTGSLLLCTADAYADSHMLPPWSEGTSTSCATGHGSQVLTWAGDGTPINCATGITASSNTITINNSTISNSTVDSANAVSNAINLPNCIQGAIIKMGANGQLTCAVPPMPNIYGLVCVGSNPTDTDIINDYQTILTTISHLEIFGLLSTSFVLGDD